MSLIDAIREAWGWTGIEPAEIVGENDFGNLLIQDRNGKYWRLCPEDSYCRVIAMDRAGFEVLLTDPEFIFDWQMAALVHEARDKCGPLTEGRKYCLKLPGILGGAYGGDNLGTVPLVELVHFSGDFARQIDDVPDGSQVVIHIDRSPPASGKQSDDAGPAV